MSKKSLKNISNKDLKAAKILKANVKKVFGNRVISVIVYGSRAEGRAQKDSDLDIFLLMKKRPKLSSKESNELSRIAFDILEKYNIYPSTVVYGEKEFNKLQNTPYIYWLKKTGVLV